MMDGLLKGGLPMAELIGNFLKVSRKHPSF